MEHVDGLVASIEEVFVKGVDSSIPCLHKVAEVGAEAILSSELGARDCGVLGDGNTIGDNWVHPVF